MPFYPDSTKWYNQVSNFLVKWKLPSDISGISVIVNKNSKADPPAKSEGLYDAKAMDSLSDGLWYVHAKLKNNIGWSPTAHYKISIDTVPPLPFTIEAVDGLSTDNPTPALKFKTSDGLSGIANYIVKVDNGEELTTTSTIIILPLQTPGKKTVIVKAIDNAGNIRESSLDMEILPIAGPVFSSINKSTFFNESDMALSGSALPGVSILLSLLREDGSLVAKINTKADAKGNWGTQFSGPFKKGTYFIEAVAQDERGALSLPVKTALFKIKEKPLLTIGGLAITQFWFFVGLIIIMLGAFGAGWMTYRLWRQQIDRKTVIAQRDIINTFNNLEINLNKLTKIHAGKIINETKTAEAKFILKTMKNHLAKAQRYIIDNIKQISD